MKEPSIEEKAKRYDEAIAKGRQIQNTPYTAHWDTMKEVVEHLFPELKENKDEMIRKALIELVRKHCVNETRCMMEEWLEKQGEQNSGLKKANDLRTWLYIVDNVLTEFQGIGQYLDNPICKEIANMLREKYCFDDTSSDWDRVYRKGLDAGEIYGYNKAKKEQNLAWSEEDELMLEGAIGKISDLGTGEMIKDWLKSLKERYTWKPSDEQMKAFYKYLNEGDKTLALSESILLRQLYNDLKKLK